MSRQPMKYSYPSVRETVVFLTALLLWLAVTILFIGFRPEHIGMAVLLSALFFIAPATRRLMVALLPFVVFGISYDWMNLLPNYEVNPIDTGGLYNLEKTLFGITAGGNVLTPNEWFALHTCKAADFLAGIFYLCWVPVPIIFGLWLYARHRCTPYLHFSLVFLLVNLLGFAGYYLHPAAPPWYIAGHGLEPVVGTMGEVAGLGAFDDMTGLGIFNGLYARNANVFAAMPSLHSAYPLIGFIYAVRSRAGLPWQIAFAVLTLGIWGTAVYTSHHYVLDVLGGIGVTLLGFVAFEWLLMKIPAFRRFIDAYSNYISAKKL